jgi:phytoene dehydrogenase-like protein
MTSSSHTYDTIVIGGGFGGMAAASLRALTDPSVLLLEHHSYLGGCASYFKRSEFTFDVGATTISGIGDNRPLSEWLNLIDLPLSLQKIDPGIVVHNSHKKFLGFTDAALWNQQMREWGATEKEIKFWNDVRIINEKAWSILKGLKKFPPQSIEDLLEISWNQIKAFPIMGHLFESFESAYIKRVGAIHPEKKKLIDQILLISTQTTGESAPFLIGCMGMCYPAETYYMEGGMFEFVNKVTARLCSMGVQIKKNHTALKIRNRYGRYEVETNRGLFKAKKIISNLPIWNMQELCEGDEQKYFIQNIQRTPKVWGAFTMYFAIACEDDFHELYHQVHTSSKIPNCDSDSFFISFSSHHDYKRAPKNYRTVTISTHTDVGQWHSDNRDAYEMQKNQTSTFIMDYFFKMFPQFKRSDVFCFNDASPSTFEAYTLRFRGHVGGIPNTLDRKIWNMTAGHTPFNRLFLVGDTTFPGQGICGVVAGALTTCRSI